MTNKEAYDALLNYTCCCKYGTSPINCSDEECDFGKAIKALANGTPYNPTVEPEKGDLISRSALRSALEITQYNDIDDLTRTERLIDNAPTVYPICEDKACKYRANERPQGDCVDISKLRLMTVEECSGHTIEYAMGWKACIEWIMKGGAE